MKPPCPGDSHCSIPSIGTPWLGVAKLIVNIFD